MWDIPPFDPLVSLGVVSPSFDFAQGGWAEPNPQYSELAELSNHLRRGTIPTTHPYAEVYSSTFLLTAA
jgi:hypothetical protein